MSGGGDSRKVVIAALAGNVAIALCKFAAAYLSKSTATLTEAVHSLADTGNQGLLLLGMRLAAKPATERFAFGRATEKYFWPFVVALMLFSIGGAFGVFEGVTQFFAPPHEGGSRFWSYGVLGVSLFFEGLSFRVAWREFNAMRGNRTWREALLETRDPTIPLVLAEDTTAIIGLTIALVAVLLSDLTGNPKFDPIGSLVIGVLLAVVAVVLARLTHGLLIGESATTAERERVVVLAEATEGVVKVTQILTMHLGPDVVLVALKVAFRPGSPVEEVENVTNEIEKKVRAEMPQMRKIFIEADSRGDGRGLTSEPRMSAASEARP